MTLAAVCFTDAYCGRRSASVFKGKAYRTDSVRMMMAAENGIVGRLQDEIHGAYSARAVVIEDYGSMTRDNLDLYGTPLAEAWCAAFSEYVSGDEKTMPMPRQGCTLIDLDKREFYVEHPFKPSPLPILLYIGPKDRCDSEHAGRWAFDRLAMCFTTPTERDLLKDISQVVQCL